MTHPTYRNPYHYGLNRAEDPGARASRGALENRYVDVYIDGTHVTHVPDGGDPIIRPRERCLVENFLAGHTMYINNAVHEIRRVLHSTPVHVYWHRARAVDPVILWLVDLGGKLRATHELDFAPPPESVGLTWHVRGTSYTILSSQCRHWPTFEEWRTRRAEENDPYKRMVREAAKDLLKAFPPPRHTVPSEVANTWAATPPPAPKPKHTTYSWKDVEFKVVGLETRDELTAELEAADEIKEALTMRIGELRDELADTLTEARAEIDRLKSTNTLYNDRYVDLASRHDALRTTHEMTIANLSAVRDALGIAKQERDAIETKCMNLTFALDKQRDAIRRITAEKDAALVAKEDYRLASESLERDLLEARKLADAYTAEAASAQRRIGAQSTLITQLRNEFDALKTHARTAAEHRDRIDHGFFFDMLINAIHNAGKIGT